MKTNTNINERVKKLTEFAKKKGLVHPHTVAFKIFPVEEEVHLGKLKNMKEVKYEINNRGKIQYT